MTDVCVALEKDAQIMGQKLLKKSVHGDRKLVKERFPILKLRRAASEQTRLTKSRPIRNPAKQNVTGIWISGEEGDKEGRNF